MALAVGAACGAFACGSAFNAAGDDGGTGDSAPQDVAQDTTLDAPGDAGPGSDGPTGSDVAEGSAAACDKTTSRCVGVPVGWSGPYELNRSATAAPCDPAYDGGTYDGSRDLMADQATCTCSCGAAEAGCSLSGAVSFYTAMSCNAMACGSQMFDAGCAAVTSACLNQIGAVAVPPADLEGGCPPQAQSIVPDASWGSSAQACSAGPLDPKDCKAGEVCAPVPATPFDTTLCVIKPGEVGCPAGFPTRYVYYGALNDTRGCTPCTCAWSGGQCLAGMTFYSDPQCLTPAGGVPAGQCLQVAPVNDDHARFMVAALDAGSCAPSGGTPTGGAQPDQPTTFCCQ